MTTSNPSNQPAGNNSTVGYGPAAMGEFTARRAGQLLGFLPHLKPGFSILDCGCGCGCGCGPSSITFPTFALAVELGWTDQAELAEMEAALKEWGDHPGAFMARMRVNAVAWKG